jgi:STE24 endopeptidase
MSILLTAAAAAAFDPDAATRAYLATLNGAARARSDAYFEGGYWLILWNALVTIAACWVLLRTRWSAAWSGWAGRTTRRPALRAALYAVPFVLVTALLTLPWTIYTEYVREHQYGLSNLSFAAWAREAAIALAVQLVVTSLLFAVVFSVIRWSPRRWWLWGAGVMTLMFAFLALVAPVFVAPLFNTYKPMPAGPLRDQILAMAHAQAVPAENVYVFDASKQSKRISANVSGLGPTIRLSLNDNLLNRSTPAEVKAVMGHELGHYVLGHIPRAILVFTLIFLVMFFALWRLAPALLARFGERWGVRDVADPAAAPLLLALAAGLGVLLTPAINTLIRVNESEADAFGLDVAREPDGFATIAIKLGEYRKLEPTPLEEAIFFDHPSGRTRVRMAMDWKARHLSPAE